MTGVQTCALPICGTGNPEWSYEQTVRVRAEEFQKAMKKGRINRYIQLGCQSDSYKKLKKTRIPLDLSVYQYIFIPNSKENHVEHRITYQIMLKAIRQQHVHPVVYEYEVWTPMNQITNYLDISDCITQKNELIQTYKCQLKHIDYISAINGLNCYRGMQYHIQYAEAFKMYKSVDKRVEDSFYKLLNVIICFVYNALIGFIMRKRDHEN